MAFKTRLSQYLVGAETRLFVYIVCHSYFGDKTGFLEDLFRQTEATGALQGGRIIQHCY
jgi:hypothetical protein